MFCISSAVLNNSFYESMPIYPLWGLIELLSELIKLILAWFSSFFYKSKRTFSKFFLS